MKKTLLAAGLLAIILAGVLYYRHVSQGPVAALLRAAQAAKAHDVATFEQYVDVASVSSSAVDQVADQAEQLGIGAQLGIWQGAMALLKPTLKRNTQEQLRAYVRTGQLPGGQKEALLQAPVLAAVGSLVGPGNQFKGIDYIRQTDAQALVGIRFTQPPADTPMVVEVRMAQENGAWRAKEITNLGNLVRTMALRQKKRWQL